MFLSEDYLSTASKFKKKKSRCIFLSFRLGVEEFEMYGITLNPFTHETTDVEAVNCHFNNCIIA